MPITAASNHSATARTAVVFCCDENYLPYALFSACQIADQNPDRGFDICLCHTGSLAIPKSLSDRGFRVIQIDTQGLFDGFGVDARRTASMYLRLALPNALGQDYDRILYLDSDVFVQGGDFDSLLGSEMHGHPLAAVRDNIQWRTPGRMPPEFKSAGLANAPYFNSGVLLIDVAQWKAQDILSKALAYEQSTDLMRHDQTLLNVVLHQNWAELSPVWNWQYSAQARLYEPMLEAHIVHFIGPRKPWNDPKGELPPRFASAISRFVAAYMPDHPSIAIGPAPARNSKAMRKMLFRHLLNLSKTQRYLTRFPTDSTTHRQDGS